MRTRLLWNHIAVAHLAIASSIVGSAAATPEIPSQVFYVATNGNDGWSGTRPDVDTSRTDGPFASFTRAIRAVREQRQQTERPLSRPTTVYIRGGSYFLNEPIVFTPADSGRADAPITYRGFGDEKPMLSGGQPVHGWTSAIISNRTLWTAQLPSVRSGRIHQFWVNGERRPRARHPNAGYLAIESVPETKPETPWQQGQSSFRFADADLLAWPTIRNAEIKVMNRWVESHLPVVDLDTAERLVRFGKNSVFKLDPGDLYYVENALEILDHPGEWYLDPADRRLYYLPLPGESLDRVETIIPVLNEIVRFDGEPEKGAFIEHLTFAGLTFAHNEWYFPSGFDTDDQKAEVWPPPAASVGGFAQAAIGVPGAIRANGLRSTLFDGCGFIQIGTYGLELARGCQRNRIVRSEFADLGAGGIKLGETAIRQTDNEVSRDNEVSDCHIHDGGQLFHSAIGIWIGQSPGNRIVHNHIHDFYYTGISVGWTWGYGAALATNTVVEFNHVHHIGRKSNGDGPILSDMGGIYTLGRHAGTVIRNNLWHDCIGLRYGGWGIYFDEGTTGIIAESNLVYRTTHGGFHQHYGRDNLVRNNIFIDAQEHQVQRSRPEEHRSFTFERNIVYWHQGKLFGGNLDDSNYLFQSNLYWNAGGDPVRFAKWSFDEWQARAQDAGSSIADPLFRDPQDDDYTLLPDSPAFQLGFGALDLRDVGIRPAGARDAALIAPGSASLISIDTSQSGLRASEPHLRLIEAGGAGEILSALFSTPAEDGAVAGDCRRLVARLPAQKDEARRFHVGQPTGSTVPQPVFRFDPVDERSLGLWEGDQPVLVYNQGVVSKPGVPADRNRSTYVHPLYGLDGEVLTDDFPVDHYHHRGLFWAWPHVRTGGREYDLWTIKGVHQRFERWLAQEARGSAALLAVENGWYAGDQKILQERVWILVHQADDHVRCIDLEFFWIPGPSAVALAGAEGKSYGGLTIRYAPRTDPVITTPRGTESADLEMAPLPWADYSGRWTGVTQSSGAALLVHPDHPDYPPTWLTRHYGALCIGWPGVEARTFTAGQPIHCRYRVWIHRGTPDQDAIEAVYATYVAEANAHWE